MLVLSVNDGEDVQIGDNITVRVWRNPDGAMRLAIDAPKELLILRGELLAKDTQPGMRNGRPRKTAATNNAAVGGTTRNAGQIPANKTCH
jgi:carbon storage regulator CsrA